MPARRSNPSRRQAKQRRALDTVDAILTGAAQVLLRSGYASASTVRIAERAGVSVGSIYQYFANKDEIIEALFQRESSRLAEQLRQFEPDPGSSLRSNLVRLLASGVHNPGLEPALYRELERVPGFEARSREFRDAVVEAICAFVAPYVPGRRTDGLIASVRLIVMSAEGLGHGMSHEEIEAGMGEEFAEMATIHLLERFGLA